MNRPDLRGPLISPNTGSAIACRRTKSRRPRLVVSLRSMRRLRGEGGEARLDLHPRLSWVATSKLGRARPVELGELPLVPVAGVGEKGADLIGDSGLG